MCRIRLFASMLFVLAGLQGSDGADRLKVSAPPAGQDSAERLVGSLATACNRGDFVGFMGHFTPSHARKIRGKMEDIFIKHQPQMDIHQVTLLSEEEDKITFAVRYAWHDKGKPETEVASKVMARMIDGHWKLDGETVRAVTRTTDSDSKYGAEESDVPDQPAGWNPFSPPARLISPNLEHLRGDIGIQPGMGCANGRCRQ